MARHGTTTRSDWARAAIESIKVARAATVQAIAAIECTAMAASQCPAQAIAAKWAKRARMELDMARMSLQGPMGKPGMSSPKASICPSMLQDGQIKVAQSLGQLSVPCRKLDWFQKVPRGQAPWQGREEKSPRGHSPLQGNRAMSVTKRAF